MPTQKGFIESGAETTCPTAPRLAVTPPDRYGPLVISTEIRACAGGRLEISAIQPP